jgi:hypothetical protein
VADKAREQLDTDVLALIHACCRRSESLRQNTMKLQQDMDKCDQPLDQA